jgi:hypothetical protein
VHPRDTVATFAAGPLDALAIGPFLVRKERTDLTVRHRPFTDATLSPVPAITSKRRTESRDDQYDSS